MWLLVRDIGISGERNRGLYVFKARRYQSFQSDSRILADSQGHRLVEVYLGPAGMLTGSARAAQEASRT